VLFSDGVNEASGLLSFSPTNNWSAHALKEGSSPAPTRVPLFLEQLHKCVLGGRVEKTFSLAPTRADDLTLLIVRFIVAQRRAHRGPNHGQPMHNLSEPQPRLAWATALPGRRRGTRLLQASARVRPLNAIEFRLAAGGEEKTFRWDAFNQKTIKGESRLASAFAPGFDVFFFADEYFSDLRHGNRAEKKSNSGPAPGFFLRVFGLTREVLELGSFPWLIACFGASWLLPWPFRPLGGLRSSWDGPCAGHGLCRRFHRLFSRPLHRPEEIPAFPVCQTRSFARQAVLNPKNPDLWLGGPANKALDSRSIVKVPR